MRDYAKRAISSPLYPQNIGKYPLDDAATTTATATKPTNRDQYPIQYVNQGNVHYLNVNSHGRLYTGAQCADVLPSTNDGGPNQLHAVRLNVVPLGRQQIVPSVRRQSFGYGGDRNLPVNASKYRADRFSGPCTYPTVESSACCWSVTQELPKIPDCAAIVDSNTSVNTLDGVKRMLDSKICSTKSFDQSHQLQGSAGVGSTPKVIVQIKDLRSSRMSSRQEKQDLPPPQPADLQIPNKKDPDLCCDCRPRDTSEDTVVLARLASISSNDVSQQMENIDEMPETTETETPRYPRNDCSESSIEADRGIHIPEPIELLRFDVEQIDDKLTQVQRIRNTISSIKHDLNELLQLQAASRIVK